MDRFFGCCCCSFPGMMSHFLIDCHVYMSICLQQDRVTCQTCCCLSFMGRGVVDKILNVICFLVLSDDFFLRSFFVYIVYTVNSFGRNQIGAADDGRWPPYRLMSSFSRQTGERHRHRQQSQINTSSVMRPTVWSHFGQSPFLILVYDQKNINWILRFFLKKPFPILLQSACLRVLENDTFWILYFVIFRT